MAVKIRLKKMGRTHRPFFRVCAMDIRSPRDGRVIEELGTYDPMIADTDARTILKSERVDYWLSVGAKPTEKVAVLIKKYGSNGTHVDAQTKALEKLKAERTRNIPVAPVASKAKPSKEGSKKETAAAEATEAPASETPAPEAAPPETPATETPASETQSES